MAMFTATLLAPFSIAFTTPLATLAPKPVLISK